MKVIFDCPVPFMLAHGGAQVQLRQTMQALEQLGVGVESMRWWDPAQSGDVLHYFGRVPTHLLRLAHHKGMKVVQEELLTEQGSRSRLRLWVQKTLIKVLRDTMPASLTAAFNWESYRLADACIANTPWEAQLMREVFGAPANRVAMVPNGVEAVFFESLPGARDESLVCTATITERKRVLELAEAAVQAGTPVWFIGQPYSQADPYAERFFRLAKQHPTLICYKGPINDRARLAGVYRRARAFVLLSTMETRSLASEEAAACGCPLLLSDLPWARSVYGAHAWYCSCRASTCETAKCLRQFYDAAPNTEPPPKPLTWREVAQQLKELYAALLRTSL